MTGNEFNFFQLPTGVEGGQTGGVGAQGRGFDLRLSNFGDLTSAAINTFADKIENPLPTDLDYVADTNPLVVGSSIKHEYNDNLIIMTMDDITPATLDVSDEKNAVANSTYYMPEEGWRSFGGKLDKERAYQGSRLQG